MRPFLPNACLHHEGFPYASGAEELDALALSWRHSVLLTAPGEIHVKPVAMRKTELLGPLPLKSEQRIR